MVSRPDSAAFLAATLLIGACGGTDTEGIEELERKAEALCQATADCLGADSGWVEACSGELDSQIAAAGDYRCLDAMDRWFTCLDANSTCTAAHGYSHEGACDEEEELAEDCRNGRL